MRPATTAVAAGRPNEIGQPLNPPVVLASNFRGAGTSEGAFADGPGEMADYRAALDFMAARYPGVELWAAGFSFGAWVAMTAGAMDDRVTTLIGVRRASRACSR